MTATAEETRSMLVSKLKLPEDNVRVELGDLTELAASIKAQGLLEPVLVRGSDNLVVCGSRRVAAAKKAGLKEIPVVVRAFTEQERVEAMIVENLQRENLTPVEEARAFARLAELGLSQRDLAARVGVSQAHVAKRLQLLKLPDKVQTQVDAGSITLDLAARLTKLTDPKAQARLATQAAKANEKPAVSWQLEQALAKDELTKKVTRARKALEAKASETAETVVTVEAGDEYGNRLAWPENTGEVRDNPNIVFSGGVSMDPKKHAKLECHALAVHPKTLETIEVCTAMDTHPNPLSKREQEEAKAKAEREKEAAAWADVCAKRLEFLQELVKRPTPAAVLELSFLHLTEKPHSYYGGGEDLLVALLGDERAEQLANEYSPPEEEGEADVLDMVAWMATRSAADKQRAVIALAVLDFELTAAKWPNGHAVTPYLRVLVELGYKLSPREKALVKEAADG